MATDEEGSLRVFVTTDDGIKTSNPDWWDTYNHLILPGTDTHPKWAYCSLRNEMKICSLRNENL